MFNLKNFVKRQVKLSSRVFVLPDFGHKTFFVVFHTKLHLKSGSERAAHIHIIKIF